MRQLHATAPKPSKGEFPRVAPTPSGSGANPPVFTQGFGAGAIISEDSGVGRGRAPIPTTYCMDSAPPNDMADVARHVAAISNGGAAYGA